MSPLDRVIFLVCADAALTKQLIGELLKTSGNYQLPIAVSAAQARKAFRRVIPTVILLDESALDAELDGGLLETAAAALSEWAPVVVLAAPERQSQLVFLLSSGAADFVARTGDFLSVAVALLERRVRMAAQAEANLGSPAVEAGADFGEVLRHEVNNPLTGILGNAELLLARREGLSAAAVQRLRTIAELAVRLRETVRRLSSAWESRHDHARSA